jgi:PAX-interacting protein 1
MNQNSMQLQQHQHQQRNIQQNVMNQSPQSQQGQHQQHQNMQMQQNFQQQGNQIKQEPTVSQQNLQQQPNNQINNQANQSPQQQHQQQQNIVIIQSPHQQMLNNQNLQLQQQQLLQQQQQRGNMQNLQQQQSQQQQNLQLQQQQIQQQQQQWTQMGTPQSPIQTHQQITQQQHLQRSPQQQIGVPGGGVLGHTIIRGPNDQQFIRTVRPHIQRKLIHLDAQTHAHLQKLDPAQRQEYLEALQKKQRNIILSQQVAYPPRGVPGTPLPPGAIIGNSPRPGMQHIVIRGQMPAGLNQQQQLQWLQQGGSRPLLVRPANAPGLSPLTPLTQQGFVAGVSPQQRPDEVNPDPNFPITEEMKLQYQQRNRQLLMQKQREMAKPVSPRPVGGGGGFPLPDSSEGMQQQIVSPGDSSGVNVNQMNAKTKTALANMLSSRLGNNGPNMPINEPQQLGQQQQNQLQQQQVQQQVQQQEPSAAGMCYLINSIV